MSESQNVTQVGIVATVAAMTREEAQAAGWPVAFWYTARKAVGAPVAGRATQIEKGGTT